MSKPRAAGLAGHALAQRINASFPQPLAVAWGKLLDADNPSAEFGSLLSTFETLIHYLGAVVVSAYLRTDMAHVKCNDHLLRCLEKEKWSAGVLLDFLLLTLQHTTPDSLPLPYPQLRDFLTTSQDGTPPAEVLRDLVSLRNDHWGHPGERSDDYYRPLVEAHRPRVEALLGQLAWLGDIRLIRPTVLDGERITRADLLNGRDRVRNQPYSRKVPRADLALHDGDIQADADTLLLDHERLPAPLPLTPLTLFRVEGRGSYFFCGAEWRLNAHNQRVALAEYIGYHCTPDKHSLGPPAHAVERLAHHVARLRLAASPALQAAPVPPRKPIVEPERVLARAEQQGHLRSFVGRQRELAEFAGWIDQSREGRYLLLLGPPGQGKSALMARLAEDRTTQGGCLLHMVKSHINPLRFLPSLIGQAAKLADVPLGAEAYQGDVDDLRDSLVGVLTTLVERRGRAVVVLDALDELPPEGNRLQFLPATLPEGVRVVLTCRPDIPLVHALRARLHACLEERTLPTLSQEDFHQYLRARLGEAGLEEVQRAVDVRLMFNPEFGIKNR